LPPRAGGYWILAGDFHVHAFPGDGSLAPWAVRAEAACAGLDVIALTNPNQMLAARLDRWLAGSSNDPIVLGGQEITHPRYHIAAIGLEHAVDADQPAASALPTCTREAGWPSPRIRKRRLTGSTMRRWHDWTGLSSRIR
jgi:hypothetical protein